MRGGAAVRHAAQRGAQRGWPAVLLDTRVNIYSRLEVLRTTESASRIFIFCLFARFRLMQKENISLARYSGGGDS